MSRGTGSGHSHLKALLSQPKWLVSLWSVCALKETHQFVVSTTMPFAWSRFHLFLCPTSLFPFLSSPLICLLMMWSIRIAAAVHPTPPQASPAQARPDQPLPLGPFLMLSLCQRRPDGELLLCQAAHLLVSHWPRAAVGERQWNNAAGLCQVKFSSFASAYTVYNSNIKLI